MVCVLCLLPPIIMVIYIKFIQPLVLRLLPESWRTAFDALLYPTCPIRVAPTQDVATACNKASDVHGEGVQKGDNCGNWLETSKKDK
uniref:Secreted protein n=1 Tax=Elaeophora elaphi TaxID=1147741 RepID=A0A0R3RZP0_9BILA